MERNLWFFIIKIKNLTVILKIHVIYLFSFLIYTDIINNSRT